MDTHVGISVAAPVVHELRIRYGECDPQGVVFNANYLAFFDIGFMELLRAALRPDGGYAAMLQRGLDFVVAEARLRYLHPARFDDVVSVEVAVDHLGTTSMTTTYRVMRVDQLLVGGTLRHVLIDLERLRGGEQNPKATIPGWMRDRLLPHVASGDETPVGECRGRSA